MQTIPFITYITQMHLLKFIVRTKLRVSKKFISINMLHFKLKYPTAMLQLSFSRFAGSRCYSVTREEGLHSLSISCFGISSPLSIFLNLCAGLVSSLSDFHSHNNSTHVGRREPSPTFKDFYSERLIPNMIYSRLRDI